MRPPRTTLPRALFALACASLALVAPVPLAGAATSGPPPRTLVVLLRATASVDHPASRAHAVAANDRVASLTESLGGTVLARTTVPDTLTVRATPAVARALHASADVAAVLPNVTIPGPADPTLAVRARGGAARHAPHRPVACGTARHPEVDPEAIGAVHATAADTLGYTGKGVKVAFLADGLAVTEADFLRNRLYASGGSPAHSRVIVQYRDFSGDGTSASTPGGEAFLDAGSIAAQGNVTYDLSRYVGAGEGVPRGCDVRIVGSAPGATVYALKIFGSTNDTTTSGFVQAINYAVTHGVNVINESFGGNPFPDEAADAVRAADEAAVAAGVTVVAATGDGGITATVGSPASDPAVIGVGASTTFRAYQQDRFGGIGLPGERGGYVDDNISALSSGGVAQDGKTVDLVAPGDLNWTLCSASYVYQDCGGLPFQLTGGTSESSPLTAGAAADVIEAYRASHHGTTPSPAVVRSILVSSATDVHAPADQQGAGLLDVGAAVRLALSMPGTTRTTAPGGLLASAGQLDLTGSPSAGTSAPLTLTNTASAAVHVQVTTRALVPFRVAHGHVTLNPSVHTKQPKMLVWSGALEVYQIAKLHVLRGDARIELQAGYRYTGQTSLLHVALFTPSGDLAGYSNPQGLGDFADVQVADPGPGTWTAAFFTLWDGYQSGNVGTSGPVPYAFTESRYRGSGSVSPSTFALAPGAARTVTFRARFASTPGDAASAIVLRTTRFAHAPVVTVETTIPVVERTVIPIGPSGGDFHGVLTGGNGRAGAPAQTNTYTFTVPAAEHDLDVGVRMARNPAGGMLPGTQLIALLVDPNGSVASYDTNFTLVAGGQVETRYVNLYATAPVAGDWSLVLEWAQPGSGVLTSIPFTGSVEFDQVSVQGDLPDSFATDVPQAGASFSVTVHDTGVAPMIVSTDARLPNSAPLTLTDVGGMGVTQSLPGASDQYYVPTQTSSVTVTETSSVPTTFDASFAPGDPDLSPQLAAPYAVDSWTPSAASVTYTPPSGVAAGLWNVFQSEEGPYPLSGEPAATETTTATVTALAFDPAVTSTVPDTVKAILDGGTLQPAFVAPGAQRVIPVTITPTAAVGAHVSGTLYVNGFTPGQAYAETIAPTALFTSDLAAIPYAYTVSS